MPTRNFHWTTAIGKTKKTAIRPTYRHNAQALPTATTLTINKSQFEIAVCGLTP